MYTSKIQLSPTSVLPAEVFNSAQATLIQFTVACGSGTSDVGDMKITIENGSGSVDHVVKIGMARVFSANAKRIIVQAVASDKVVAGGVEIHLP